jgi:hypothetical protein
MLLAGFRIEWDQAGGSSQPTISGTGTLTRW